jgi:hypothetical protein
VSIEVHQISFGALGFCLTGTYEKPADVLLSVQYSAIVSTQFVPNWWCWRRDVETGGAVYVLMPVRGAVYLYGESGSQARDWYREISRRITGLK